MGGDKGNNHDDEILLSKEQLQKIKQLVANRKNHRLNALLETTGGGDGSSTKGEAPEMNPQGTAPTPKLIPSPPLAASLLNILKVKLLPNNGPSTKQRQTQTTILSLDESLRALLMIPTTYTTPWRALCEMATCLQHADLDELLDVATTMEEFLVHTKSEASLLPPFSQKPKIHRKLHGRQGTMVLEDISSKSSSTTGSSMAATAVFDKHSAEGMLDQFAESILQHFTVSDTDTGETTAKSNRLDDLLCDITYHVLSLAQQVDDQPHGLFETIVGKISFRADVRIARLLRVAQRTRPLLREEQLKDMSAQLLEHFHNQQITPHQLEDSEIPALLTMVLEMVPNASERTRGKAKQQRDTKPTATWQAIALCCLYQAYVTGPASFVTAETAVSRALLNWSSNDVKDWVEQIPAILDETVNVDKGIPSWFGWCILLVCFEALNEMSPMRWSMSDAILEELFSARKRSSSSDLDAWKTENFLPVFLQLGTKKRSEHNVSEKMDKVRYDGRGIFTRVEEGEEDVYLSTCGRCIWQTVFLGTDEGVLESSIAFERAQRIMKVLEAIRTEMKEDQVVGFSIVWSVFAAVAYFDIPPYRDTFLGNVKNNLNTEGEDLVDAEFFDLSALAFIVSLIDNGDRKEATLLVDSFEGLFDENWLKGSRLHHVCNIFLNFQSLRPKILESIRLTLAPLYLHPVRCLDMQDERDSSEMSLDSAREHASCEAATWQNEAICPAARAEYGFLCLLDLLRITEWKVEETVAGAILSDAVVLDTPCISVKSRLWIYESIAELVAEEGYCEATKLHLLPVLVTRLSFFFSVGESVHGSIRVEEISSIFRLILSMLVSLTAGCENSEFRLSLLAQGREAFLRFVLDCQKMESTASKHVEIFVQTSILDEEDAQSDVFALCWAVYLMASVQMMSLIDPAAPKHGRSPRPRVERSASSEIRIDFLTDRIRRLEASSLKAISSESHMPSWTILRSCQDRGTETTWFDGSSFQNPFVCLLLELLYSTPLPVRSAQGRDDHLAWKMIKGTEYLMNQEWQQDKAVRGGEDMVLLDQYTIEQTGHSMLSLFTTSVREATRRDYELDLVDGLFNSIVTYCDSISFSQLKSPCDSWEIFLSLWDLYNGVASEQSAVKIVLYLEYNLPDHPRPSKSRNGKHLTFLNPFENGKDVNRAIRSLRISCLRALGVAISCLATKEDVRYPYPSNDVLAGMLEALAEDLRKGLAGESGGISSQLYMSYCSVIEKCATFVFDEAHLDGDSAVVSLFDKVACILSDILIHFPLGAAERFKTTFALGLVTLPSMCQSLIRSGLCADPNSGRLVKLPETPSFGLFDVCFDDCVLILSRWSTLRDPLSVPWEDIAGRHHTATPNTSETSVVSLGSHDDKRNLIGNSHVIRRIRLLDKEVWSWALSCSLFGLKRIWLDSYDIVRENIGACTTPSSVKSHSNWKAFFKLHSGDLRSTLTKIERFFQASTAPHEHIALDMLAMNMPSHPRDLLCSLVACVSQVLAEACKQIVTVLKSKMPSQNLLSLPTLESLCMLASWLSKGNVSGDASNAVLGGDFMIGVFRWLEMASRKRPPNEVSSKSSRRADSKELREKVSSVTEYVYQLYLALKELERSLRKCDVSTDFSKICKAFFGDDGIHRTKYNTSGGRQTDLLQHFVSLKLRLLLKAMPREYRERSLPDFPAIATTSKSSINMKSKRGRPTSSSSWLGQSRLFSTQHQRTKKTSRLQLLLSSTATGASAATTSRVSRNPALEAMWALDQEADREQDGKKLAASATNNSNNKERKKRKWNIAAADLEDFITPG